MQETKITAQEERQHVQAQGRLIADFYTGRLNAAGRNFLMTVLAQLNQPCYLKAPEEIDVSQEMPQDDRGGSINSIVALNSEIRAKERQLRTPLRLRFNYDARAEERPQRMPTSWARQAS